LRRIIVGIREYQRVTDKIQRILKSHRGLRQPSYIFQTHLNPP
jgi:hypothetical protein